ncbi:Cof-type HAD-IIB family hydrolase [Microbacterium sp. NPDC055910]|uniref:Cof-type HAD-IIB family hydrolase n=1 Tax=Microbacterium sp. NPDC055910 TaxID=3345659 RepID=UPI0035DB898F
MTPHRTGRIVFIDVDGTIIDHDEYVAPSTVAAIRGAREAGHLVYLCTGRARGDLHPAVRAIGFDGAITNGGATAHVADEQIVSRLMPAASVSRLVGSFEARGIHYFLQTDDEVFASPGMLALVRERVRAARTAAVEGPEDSLAGIGHRTYRDVSDAPRDTVAKAVFVSLADDAVEVLDRELGDEFHVVNGSMPLPGGTSGEICMLGTNKGSAIELVLEHLGLEASDAVGVGDSWNDVEMFEVCGTAVAMGNAEPTLKALADHITTTVRDNGVWNAFRALDLVG